MQQKPQDSIKYDDLRDDFVKELVNHYRHNKHQFVRGTTKLTDSIDLYLKGDQSETEWNSLLQVAENNIYNNVFDAFQNVGSGTIGDAYTLFEHDKKNRRIVLTDNTNLILENTEFIQDISAENQSRWNIVEEAWRSGLTPNLLVYDKDENTFYSESKQHERIGLRSAVDVLMPYQKGRCFYCNTSLDRYSDSQNDSFPDVDHFLPFAMMNQHKSITVNPNGVWNLVITCKQCNRGKDGKFDSIPDSQYFSKLLARNLLFVEEHKHSLRNSILLSLNAVDKQSVKSTMLGIYNVFKMIRGWKPKEFIYE
jgi:5-methylcytosine-specific restriction endonuclease McrA